MCLFQTDSLFYIKDILLISHLMKFCQNTQATWQMNQVQLHTDLLSKMWLVQSSVIIENDPIVHWFLGPSLAINGNLYLSYWVGKFPVCQITTVTRSSVWTEITSRIALCASYRCKKNAKACWIGWSNCERPRDRWGRTLSLKCRWSW